MINNIRNFFELHPVTRVVCTDEENLSPELHLHNVRFLDIDIDTMKNFVEGWLAEAQRENSSYRGHGLCFEFKEMVMSEGEAEEDVSNEDFANAKTPYNFMSDLIFFAKTGVQYDQSMRDDKWDIYEYPFGTRLEYNRECNNDVTHTNRQRLHFISELLKA